MDEDEDEDEDGKDAGDEAMVLKEEEEENDEAIGRDGGDTKRKPYLHRTVNPDIFYVKEQEIRGRGRKKKRRKRKGEGKGDTV